MIDRSYRYSPVWSRHFWMEDEEWPLLFNTICSGECEERDVSALATFMDSSGEEYLDEETIEMIKIAGRISERKKVKSKSRRDRHSVIAPYCTNVATKSLKRKEFRMMVYSLRL